MNKYLIAICFVFIPFSYLSSQVKKKINQGNDDKFGMMQSQENIQKDETYEVKKTNIISSISSKVISPKRNKNNFEKIDYPIFYDFELYLDDLYNVDLKNDYFYSKLYLAVYSKYDSIGVGKDDNLVSTVPEDNFRLKYQLGDESFVSKWIYQGFIKDSLYQKYSYVSEVENNFFHDWNLTDYPFDLQNLKIEFISKKDTSDVILRSANNFPPTFNRSISDLKEGYNIIGITSEVTYYESPFDFTSLSGERRKKVFSKLTYNIEIDRSGSWLFVKLFIGSFLSFFISWVVFMIPLKEFESRISLSVGAIFGAIGNRYFVDSTMQNVQVLTKADLLNNLVLILLAFNILIVILQENKNFSIPYLEDNKNAMRISALSLVVLGFLIYIF